MFFKINSLHCVKSMILSADLIEMYSDLKEDKE